MTKKEDEVMGEVCKGLAEVSLMLGEYDKKHKKIFQGYAKKFCAFSKIYAPSVNSEINKEEDNMARKLTDKEKEDTEIRGIIKKIISLETKHPKKFVERACYRYKDASLRKRNAEKEIKLLERKQ